MFSSRPILRSSPRRASWESLGASVVVYTGTRGMVFLLISFWSARPRNYWRRPAFLPAWRQPGAGRAPCGIVIWVTVCGLAPAEPGPGGRDHLGGCGAVIGAARPPQATYHAVDHDGVCAELAGVFRRPGRPVPAGQRRGVGGERAGWVDAPQWGT